MELDQHERDPFEAFEGFGDAGEAREIDLSPIETHAVDTTEINPPRVIEQVENIDTAQIAASEPPKVKPGFSWTGFMGGLAALAWIGAAIGGPLSYYGFDAVMRMDPSLQAGLVALAFGPAVLFWLSAAAAAEAFKARRIATALTRMSSDGQTLPAIATGELQAQRLTHTVKAEIEALNDAVGAALARLSDLEASARRNAALFDDAIAASRENAEYMTSRLANERDALIDINGELRGQTDTMAQSIGRQVRLMREASKLVKTELSAAEDALEAHLHSFGQAATAMADNTASFHHAADGAAAATASLNNTMVGMLDGLGEATRLTDAARQSAEQATLAANETANAVRETTRNAVFEAKRAAQAIRAETSALQEAAVTTMDKLREAAEAARAASMESQAAADAHAAKIEKRLAALATTAGAKRAAPPQTASRVEEQRLAAQPAPVRRDEARKEDESLYVAAQAAVARGQSRPVTTARVESAPASDTRARGNSFKGFGGWTNLFPSREEAPMPRAANEPEAADAFALVDFGAPRKDPDVTLKADAVNLCLDAGVDLDATLKASDLDQIAQSSRLGAVARRRAVADAAPGAVNRIARHIRRDTEAKLVASEFRARPDLAKSEKKGEASDLVRAYLLIDAALA
ncbi:MAG TPA: hypothetical protein VG841_02170 [Caulobacterales bacterium]|nr:hypothetical protein [Caulobacterales bacterium]